MRSRAATLSALDELERARAPGFALVRFVPSASSFDLAIEELLASGRELAGGSMPAPVRLALDLESSTFTLACGCAAVALELR